MEFESLPAITVPEVRKVLTRMKGKAGGPDGWTTDLIDQLPDVFIQRLCQFVQACENAGSWPLGLRDWAVRFIPKKKTGSIPELGSLCPISIGPVVYRVWSAVRLRHLTPRLKGLFDRHQILDVYDCLISLHQEYPENDYPFGLCLDFSKCFDSCDAALCVQLFRRLGLPSPVCTLLAAQWANHSRWVCFGDAVSSRPICAPLGLPQGDPWSPCTLMLCLLLPLRCQLRTVPDTRALLFLDDRIISPSLPSLQRAVGVWTPSVVLRVVAPTRLKRKSGRALFLPLSPSKMLGGLLPSWLTSLGCPWEVVGVLLRMMNLNASASVSVWRAAWPLCPALTNSKLLLLLWSFRRSCPGVLCWAAMCPLFLRSPVCPSLSVRVLNPPRVGTRVWICSTTVFVGSHL